MFIHLCTSRKLVSLAIGQTRSEQEEEAVVVLPRELAVLRVDWEVPGLVGFTVDLHVEHEALGVCGQRAGEAHRAELCRVPRIVRTRCSSVLNDELEREAAQQADTKQREHIRDAFCDTH